MRDIKFRALAEGGMCDNLDSVNLEMLRKSVITFDGENFVPASYMQYTGLKDKNGKEIYEGDIIDYGGVYGKKEVFFINGSFGVITRQKNGASFGAYNIQDGVIIGNIYENPELLKQSA